MNDLKVTVDNVGNDLVLSKEFIETSVINSINVPNTKESYEKYFKLGGTVSKMSMSSTQKYSTFVKKRKFSDVE